MFSFKNDYNQVGHKKILNAISNISNMNLSGYGTDEITENAKKIICEKLNHHAYIDFLVGGTQANLTVISSILRPYEAVISTIQGHIYTNETGAIEAKGNKIITLDSTDGKIDAEKLEEYMYNYKTYYESVHKVIPAMLYISNPTELGTIYTKNELKKLYEICKKYNLTFYMDGARLAYIHDAIDNDVKLEDLKDLVDVYYIGGTKCGTLFGEAVVFNNTDLAKNFKYCTKQNGALLAKGFLLGVQFQELFKDNFYEEVGIYANALAKKLNDTFEELSIEMFINRQSNQLFPILKNDIIEKLKEKYLFEFWEKIDDEKTAVRFVTSWSTDEKAVDSFILDLKELMK